MIRIRPFRALHYDAAAVGDLAAVIAPPYDVIDDRQLERLYGRSPYNAVRLILNRSPDRYAASAAELIEWRARGVLTRDAQPCLYYYVQDFALPDGGRRQRAGLMAAVRLERFADGNIRPHERTFARAKEDRLKLLDACRANLSPIFGIYPDRLQALEPARRQSAEEAPWIDVGDEAGDRHRVWRIADPSRIDGIGQALSDRTVFIADGHHRYETALAYQDRRHEQGDTDPEAPHNYVLMYLTSMDEPGLVLLPTHRVWRGEAKDWLGAVGEHFRVEDFPATPEGERSAAGATGGRNGARRRRLAPAGSRLSAAPAGREAGRRGAGGPAPGGALARRHRPRRPGAAPPARHRLHARRPGRRADLHPRRRSGPPRGGP